MFDILKELIKRVFNIRKKLHICNYGFYSITYKMKYIHTGGNFRKSGMVTRYDVYSVNKCIYCNKHINRTKIATNITSGRLLTKFGIKV